MPSKINRDIETSYVWDIADFASLSTLDYSNISLQSPLFNKRSIDEMWKFHIHPDGKSDEDYIGFYLSKIKVSNQAVYNFTLSVGRPNSTPVKSHKYTGKRFVGPAIGEERFLCKKSNDWILKGPVRFRCDITKMDSENHDLTPASLNSSVPLDLEDTANLSTDLEKLLKIPFHSDLTVKMSEKVMHIHKYMLQGARFLNMSSQSGCSTVMEWPPSLGISHQSLELLIRYIYTGKFGDSHVPLDLFRYAERSGLSSLMQSVHEQTCSYQVYSEADVEEKFINWNLDELEFSEEGSTCVHILRTTLYAEKLAVQVNISDGCENETFIDVSFKFFEVYENRPIILISKISLTSEVGIEAFKEEKHVFLKNEQWDFSRLLCQKDRKDWFNLEMRLRVELSIFEWSNLRKVKGIKTKTKLYTKFQTVTDNLHYLRGNMAWLWEVRQWTSNLLLLSEDNKFFQVHDGILWARWPGVKKLIDKNSNSSDKEATGFVELKLPSNVLDILLPYLYTGFMKNFDKEKAKMLLKYGSELEFPDHLMEKCKALLVNHEN